MAIKWPLLGASVLASGVLLLSYGAPWPAVLAGAALASGWSILKARRA
jgi:hypothetical protein